MTTKNSEEALRLADELAVFATWRDDSTGTLGKSAAELRRLFAANQAMLEALKAYNLKHRMTYGLDGAWDEEITKGEAAIAKAEDMNKGEQQT